MNIKTLESEGTATFNRQEYTAIIKRLCIAIITFINANQDWLVQL